MKLNAFSTCDLCDANGADTSGAFRVLPPVFKDFGAQHSFFGEIYTVRALDDNSRVREAVQTPGSDRVLVIDAGGLTERAMVGGNVAAQAAQNGWAGMLVNGCVRDVAELRSCGIPIRALALMPMRTQKRGEGQSNVPVQVRGVWIRPGDWLYADEDGILISERPLI